MDVRCCVCVCGDDKAWVIFVSLSFFCFILLSCFLSIRYVVWWFCAAFRISFSLVVFLFHFSHFRRRIRKYDKWQVIIFHKCYRFGENSVYFPVCVCVCVPYMYRGIIFFFIFSPNKQWKKKWSGIVRCRCRSWEFHISVLIDHQMLFEYLFVSRWSPSIRLYRQFVLPISLSHIPQVFTLSS